MASIWKRCLAPLMPSRAHKQKFVLDADEPPILAGNDDGANPVEHLLNALAACVTTSMVAQGSPMT
jgi:uncharacterized OsmC-like protein